MKSHVALTVERDAFTTKQWAVQDRRTGKIVRTASTRSAAANKSRLSRHYRIVQRQVIVGSWE